MWHSGCTIDLHGLTAEEAHTTFEGFLKKSVMAGKRAVMVIHGRGRSSPSEPIIKNKVVEWLTGGPWRKWVMAFSSARTCDGGAGATYILLRERPVTKRYRNRGTRRTRKNGLE
jgi:DNA-nicking Smr family endonuclease